MNIHPNKRRIEIHGKSWNFNRFRKAFYENHTLAIGVSEGSVIDLQKWAKDGDTNARMILDLVPEDTKKAARRLYEYRLSQGKQADFKECVEDTEFMQNEHKTTEQWVLNGNKQRRFTAMFTEKSREIAKRISRECERSASCFLLWEFIRLELDFDTFYCKVSPSELAAETGLNKVNVSICLKELEKIGAIKRSKIKNRTLIFVDPEIAFQGKHYTHKKGCDGKAIKHDNIVDLKEQFRLKFPE